MILIRTEKGNQYKSFLSLFFHKTLVIKRRQRGFSWRNNLYCSRTGRDKISENESIQCKQIVFLAGQMRAIITGVLCSIVLQSWTVFSPVRGWYICWSRTRLRFCLSSALVVSAERFILVALLLNSVLSSLY